MRRVITLVLAAIVVCAVAPGGALARHGSHHQRRHRQARIEHFRANDTSSGGDTTSTGSTTPPAGAGTVDSFANGILTITVNGSPVSGAVTDGTEIECTSAMQTQTTHEDGDGGSGGDQSGDGGQNGGGNQSGDGGQNSGEDQGGQGRDDAGNGEDQGEDQGNGNANSCSSANLTPGASVRQADLRITSTGNVWKDVELQS